MGSTLLIGGTIALLLVLAVVLVRHWRGRDVIATPVVGSVSSQLDTGDAELEQLLAAGNKLGAIKRVRELTGMDLKQAKDYVEGLPTSSRPLPPQAGVPASGESAALEQEARQLLSAGNKLGAIKRVRELTGMDLKQAKDYVERLERRQ